LFILTHQPFPPPFSYHTRHTAHPPPIRHVTFRLQRSGGAVNLFTFRPSFCFPPAVFDFSLRPPPFWFVRRFLSANANDLFKVFVLFSVYSESPGSYSPGPPPFFFSVCRQTRFSSFVPNFESGIQARGLRNHMTSPLLFP